MHYRGKNGGMLRAHVIGLGTRPSFSVSESEMLVTPVAAGELHHKGGGL
jgi:hypothetical protein